jgi:hypothetical protein
MDMRCRRAKYFYLCPRTYTTLQPQLKVLVSGTLRIQRLFYERQFARKGVCILKLLVYNATSHQLSLHEDEEFLIQ